MSDITIFSEKEHGLVAECLSLAEKKKPSQAEYIRANLEALVQLAEVISSYPSILETQTLGEKPRSPQTLVSMLCQQPGTRRLLHTPTRAVLGESFLVAKINLLYLVKYVYDSSFLKKVQADAVLDAIITNIFTLMSEDVFLEIIEAGDITAAIKEKAARQLLNIWEWRLNKDITDYAPVLFSMWKARRHLRPIFGTLMGVSELYQISGRVHPVWSEFLADRIQRVEVFQALEEFLFNLTFEELESLRSEMKARGLDSVSSNKAAALIGKSSFYSDFNESDPRELYAFFQQRRANARFRCRAGRPGPAKTLEEYLLCYLLENDL